MLDSARNSQPGSGEDRARRRRRLTVLKGPSCEQAGGKGRQAWRYVQSGSRLLLVLAGYAIGYVGGRAARRAQRGRKASWRLAWTSDSESLQAQRPRASAVSRPVWQSLKLQYSLGFPPPAKTLLLILRLQRCREEVRWKYRCIDLNLANIVYQCFESTRHSARASSQFQSLPSSSSRPAVCVQPHPQCHQVGQRPVVRHEVRPRAPVHFGTHKRACLVSGWLRSL